MRIAFRTDASREIGSGHVMRCISLAQELTTRGAKVSFVCRRLPDHYAALAAQAGASLLQLPDEGDDAMRSRGLLGGAGSWDWLVVDQYSLAAPWERAMRTVARRIMVIDDLADRPHDCDLLLDQNLARDSQARYANRVPPGCTLLLGPAYALLRPQFAEARERERKAGDERRARRVLVMFGGADPEDLTARCVRLLADAEFPGHVDILVGPLHAPSAALRAALARLPSVSVHREARDVSALMAQADLAIGSPGVSSWERCVLGLPTIALAFAANQEAPAEALAAAGAHWYAGRAQACSDSYLAALIQLAVEDKHARAAMGQAARGVCDGRGPQRVASHMLAATTVNLRPASMDDLSLLYGWRNDERVRRHSFDPSAVSFADHTRWFQQCLSDPQRRLFMALRDGAPAGCIRLDIRKETAEVSLYVDPERFGEGIGTAMLRAAADWAARNLNAVTRLTGNVLQGNRASHAAFLAAGFTPSHVTYSLALERP